MSVDEDENEVKRKRTSLDPRLLRAGRTLCAKARAFARTPKHGDKTSRAFLQLADAACRWGEACELWGPRA